MRGIKRAQARRLLYHSNITSLSWGAQHSLKLDVRRQFFAKLCNFRTFLRKLQLFFLGMFLHFLVAKINSYCSAKDGLIVIQYTDLLRGSAQKLRYPSEFQDNICRDLGISVLLDFSKTNLLEYQLLSLIKFPKKVSRGKI